MAKSYPRFLGGICANVRTNGPAPGTPTAYVLICVGELNKILFSMFCCYIFVGLHYFGYLPLASEASGRPCLHIDILEKYFGRFLYGEYILRAENEFYWNVVCVKAFSRPVQNGAWLAVHSSGASDNRTTGGCPAAPASTLLANKRGQFVQHWGRFFEFTAVQIVMPRYNLSIWQWFYYPEIMFGALY